MRFPGPLLLASWVTFYLQVSSISEADTRENSPLGGDPDEHLKERSQQVGRHGVEFVGNFNFVTDEPDRGKIQAESS